MVRPEPGERASLVLRTGQGRVDCPQRTEFMEPLEDALGLALAEDVDEFVVKAGAADRLNEGHVPPDPAERFGFDVEAEAGLVAGGAEDARGVVLEAAFVEDADEARVQVVAAAVRVEKGARSWGRSGDIAIALMVKSRRRRSSLIVAGVTCGRAPGRR